MKNKEEIAQVLKNIEEHSAIANAEIPANVGFRDVTAYQRLRAMAAETAYNDRAKYGAYVEGHLGTIILKGDRAKQEEFAKKAQEIGKTLTYDTNKLYEQLTTSAFYMMGGTGSMGADQFALIFTEIRIFHKDMLGITRIREPEFSWMFNYAWKSNESLAEGIRKSLFATNGILLTLKAIQREAIVESLATPNPRTTIPMVVIGIKDAEEEQFKAAFSHGYTVVDVDVVEPTEENITKTFIELRDTIKTKTTTKETNNG